MRLRPVVSRSLKAVGYDSLRRILAIRFEDGSLYYYSSVPSRVHTELLKAKSKGSYFTDHIRNAYQGIK